jgi:hypothetical protein
MDDNPYQSPSADMQAIGVRSGKREDLKAIATYQKGIMVCILMYLLAVIGQFALPPELRPLVGLGVLLVGVGGFICVLLLAMKVYSTGTGILLAILTFIPVVGLIVLLSVNGKATSILKANGHAVGLLGASLSEF